MSKRFLLLVLFLAVRPGLPASKWRFTTAIAVAFYGDSITAQRFYTRFVEDLVLTRDPKLHVTFCNAGVPGDTVNGGYTGDAPTRLKRDLFPQHPTVVTIMLGMNDGYYMPFDQKYLDIYEDGYRKLLASIQTNLPGVRITLISPTPYDELTHGTEFAHYNEVIARHARIRQGACRLVPLYFQRLSTGRHQPDAGRDAEEPVSRRLAHSRSHPSR